MRGRNERAWIAGAVLIFLLAVALIIPSSPVRAGALAVTKYYGCTAPHLVSGNPPTVGFGDSITAGHHVPGIGASDSYYDLLGCWSEIGYEGNVGEWGETTTDMLDRVDDVIAMNPEQVLILGGTNDVVQGDTSSSVENIARMVESFEDAGITPVVGLLPPSETFPAETVKFNESLEEWAGSEGVQVIDFWTPLADPDGTYRHGMNSDPIHPSRDGAHVMAVTAAETLD